MNIAWFHRQYNLFPFLSNEVAKEVASFYVMMPGREYANSLTLTPKTIFDVLSFNFDLWPLFRWWYGLCVPIPLRGVNCIPWIYCRIAPIQSNYSRRSYTHQYHRTPCLHSNMDDNSEYDMEVSIENIVCLWVGFSDLKWEV